MEIWSRNFGDQRKLIEQNLSGVGEEMNYLDYMRMEEFARDEIDGVTYNIVADIVIENGDERDVAETKKGLIKKIQKLVTSSR